eukprot:gnl/TRDRNA2_/TRDRNA2_182055_c0_seq1.p1 gnl/TRDRNA2_/TRDRNA2_182055_c0~~gnl/TRDRNA2_/TRDRNA2_182055_c0_seq1.p1  ORF type:complete len:252 (+),score=79.99 gnl/TRDRNA2_/TRDRNA2_182055_c0_seq1:69-824(+)
MAEMVQGILAVGMAGGLRQPMKELLEDLAASEAMQKQPEFRWRLNKIDSCSDEEPSEEAKKAYFEAQAAAAVAASEGVVQKQSQVDIKQVFPTQSLLHEMVAIDKIDKVSKFIDKGFSVNEADCMGDTPLMWAASAEMIDYLVGEGADVEAKNFLSGCSVFFKLAYQGKHRPLKAVGKYLEKADKLGDAVQEAAKYTQRTALHAAAINGHVETVKLLLSFGADKDAQDTYGKTALDLAKEMEFDDVITLLE